MNFNKLTEWLFCYADWKKKKKKGRNNWRQASWRITEDTEVTGALWK